MNQSNSTAWNTVYRITGKHVSKLVTCLSMCQLLTKAHTCKENTFLTINIQDSVALQYDYISTINSILEHCTHNIFLNNLLPLPFPGLPMSAGSLSVWCHSNIFHRLDMDIFPTIQPTVSMHWRKVSLTNVSVNTIKKTVNIKTQPTN